MEMIFTAGCYWKFFIVIDREYNVVVQPKKESRERNGICIQNVVFDISVDNLEMRWLIVRIDASQLRN